LFAVRNCGHPPRPSRKTCRPSRRSRTASALGPPHLTGPTPLPRSSKGCGPRSLNRPTGPSPARRDGGSRLGRLTGRAVHQIVGKIGKQAALSAEVRPHGLRHAGITRALDLYSGDVRKVQKFSRHTKLDILLQYDDNRQDPAGEVAGKVSEE
jgi:integrase